jgi:hypothetical protein
MGLASEACGMHKASADGNIRQAKNTMGEREFDVAAVTDEICVSGIRFG